MHRLDAGTRIRGALDKRNRPMHCHHEKLVIVDGTVAFVGGIDLTDLSGDRFDGPPHAKVTQLGWHDVAASLAGPAVADVAAHFAMRWHATTGEMLPRPLVPGPAGSSRVQVVRTVPEKTYPALPRGDFSILEAYMGARAAREAAHLSREPVPLERLRWWRCCARSCCGRRATSSGWCLCCHGGRTTATTTRVDSSACSRLRIVITACLFGTVGHAGTREAGRLRPRKGRDRRRRVAHRRIGESQ